MPLTSSNLIQSYLKKFPKTPSGTLAKMIYKEYPELFSGVENVRTNIRYWRGKNGKDSKKRLSTKEFLQQYKGKTNPYQHIPNGKKYDSATEVVQLEGKRFLIINDIHIPYHDKEALGAALTFAKEKKIDHLVLNGDICDFFSISQWQKSPDEINFQLELETCVEILSAIRASFPKIKITFKLGNHEDRLIRYLRIKSPELFGVEFIDISNILKLDELDIQVVDSLNLMKIGKHLFVAHGHEFGTTNTSVNPARGYFMKSGECLIAGHFHRTSQHGKKTIKNKIIQCWSVGCLCDMKPQYHSFNDWNHGFAYVTSDEDDFQVTNKIIIDGKIQS